MPSGQNYAGPQYNGNQQDYAGSQYNGNEQSYAGPQYGREEQDNAGSQYNGNEQSYNGSSYNSDQEAFARPQEEAQFGKSTEGYENMGVRKRQSRKCPMKRHLMQTILRNRRVKKAKRWLCKNC